MGIDEAQRRLREFGFSIRLLKKHEDEFIGGVYRTNPKGELSFYSLFLIFHEQNGWRVLLKQQGQLSDEKEVASLEEAVQIVCRMYQGELRIQP